MTPTLEPFNPPIWEDGLYETKLEAQLAASLNQARKEVALPKDSPLSAPGPTLISTTAELPKSTAISTLANATLSELIGGCGIAAIDGYLAMRDYAAAKGLDLVEFHHKGIDLQDIISTLVIHTQKMAEMENRQPTARYRR